jgi:hypothetical protein
MACAQGRHVDRRLRLRRTLPRDFPVLGSVLEIDRLQTGLKIRFASDSALDQRAHEHLDPQRVSVALLFQFRDAFLGLRVLNQLSDRLPAPSIIRLLELRDSLMDVPVGE